MRVNKFIAIEGLDGSGKSTQIKLLTANLAKRGIRTQFVHFPRANEGVFGKLVAQFLRGDFGAVKDVHPQLVALLFAEDRKEFSAIIEGWLDQGFFVLVDRYVPSNIAFQCAKTPIGEKEGLKKWINEFEYIYNHIQKPDITLYLDVPFSFTEQSLQNRHKEEKPGYLNGKDDIHELDLDLQRAVKLEYEKMLKTDSDIVPIKCYNDDNTMKTSEEVHAIIMSRVEDLYRAHM